MGVGETTFVHAFTTLMTMCALFVHVSLSRPVYVVFTSLSVLARGAEGQLRAESLEVCEGVQVETCV